LANHAAGVTLKDANTNTLPEETKQQQ